jgi:hypothetical protein
MKGDFTRCTFNPLNRFVRVLMQQGRVQLDADWNEQVAVLLHYLHALAADLIGPHGGIENSFKVEELKDANSNSIPRDFLILPGHYYVDGILCESEEEEGLAYTNQPDYRLRGDAELNANKTYLVYLDVWERHITYIEEDRIREVALSGPDTATRAKLVWQVKTTNETGSGHDIPPSPPASSPNWRAWVENNWGGWLNLWQPKDRGGLKARTKETPKKDTDPCTIPPESRYRGTENQLYRVEIHKGGETGEATFKWSRDNGSVTFPIRKLEGKRVELEHLGRDNRLSLAPGDWVEIVDDNYALRGEGGPLVQVDKVNRVEMTVTLMSGPGLSYDETSETHPLLRRWDYRAGDPTKGEPEKANDGALLVKENDWLTLEDGIQIYFQSPSNGEEDAIQKNIYRAGDYWMIPARIATGDVEWPADDQGDPVAQTPHGVEHHYAPLAIITLDNQGNVTSSDLRRKIKQVSEPA